MLDTTNSRAISNISKYFLNTMKGMKCLEYKIWSRSFINDKGDFETLSKVQVFLRKLRLHRPNLSLKISSS